MPEHADLTLLLEAFARNGEVNAILLGALVESDLDLSDGKGGWTIGQHLAHAAEFRHGWLSRISPQHAEGIPSVADEGEDGSIVLTTRSPAVVAEAFAAGDRAALAAVNAALDEGRSFERAYQSHPAQFLVHAVVHDAHHRGQAVSLLRAGGSRTAQQLEDLEDLMWPVWRR